MRVAKTVSTRLEAAPRPFRILDLCTGSGCIALLLAHELRACTGVSITAIDCDAQALELARGNAQRLDMAHVQFVHADLLHDTTDVLGTNYDLVVCNPPYVRQDEWHSLAVSVRGYESHGALVGHAAGDGLAYYRRVAELVRDGLVNAAAPAPQLVLEVGAGQAANVRALLGTHRCTTWHDYRGIERVVTYAHGPSALGPRADTARDVGAAASSRR